MNPADIIVGAIVALILLFAVLLTVKRKRKGDSCCGGCDKCSRCEKGGNRDR